MDRFISMIVCCLLSSIQWGLFYNSRSVITIGGAVFISFMALFCILMVVRETFDK
jgi:hypothetical protein